MKKFLLIPLLFFVGLVNAQEGVRAIDPPAYGILSGIQAIWESVGTRQGVTNEYGSIISDNNVSTVKSIRPGPVGRDLTSTGTLLEAVRRVMVNGIPVFDHNELRWLRQVGSVSTWDFMSYNATFANMRWTVTMLVKPGHGADPQKIGAFLGNGAGTLSTRGFYIAYDDRGNLGSNNKLTHSISRGTTAVSISGDNNIITPNQWDVWTFTFDGSQTAANRFKAYKNKVQQSLNVTSATTAVVSVPSHELEVFALGNSQGPSAGQWTHLIIQNVVESQAVREAFIDSLEPYRAALNEHTNDDFHVYQTLQDDGTPYYLPAILCQNPLSPSTIVRIFRVDTDHVAVTGVGKLQIQKSTDYGLTWDTPRTFSDPAGNYMTGGVAGGYDENGRLWVFADWRNIGAPNNLPFELHVYYSDDDGDTAPTDLNITSQLPPDGHDIYSTYGNMLASGGRKMTPLYTATTDLSTSANYIIYTDDDGEDVADWSYKTIRASGVDYINEMWLAKAGGRIFTYARNEEDNAWVCFSTFNNGDTWVNNGTVTLGEALLAPCPVMFSQFDLYGVNVTAVWFSERDISPEFKVVFQRTDALEANATVFDLDTKIVLRQRMFHYGQVVHPYNNFYSIGAFPLEPITSPLSTNNQLVQFFGGVRYKDFVMSQLGITKQ